MENKTITGTRSMVELSLMSAILIVMSMTPLGYIKTPFLSITLLTIPVAVGAMLLGPKGGAVLGAVFGATSFVQALTGAGMTAILFQTNPLGTICLCFVPRILEGFFCGLFFNFLRRHGIKKAAFYLGGFSCPILNTILFTGTLVLLFYQTDYIQTLAASCGTSNPFAFILALVGIQGVIEAAVCGTLSGTISMTLVKAFRR